MTNREIAKLAHEANRSYCRMIGDYSQVAWEDAPEWQKDSAIKGVEAILANPDLTPEQGHEKWLEVKKADGWHWGPEKRPELKEHPCMVAYSQLPVTQRMKDYLFHAVVEAALKVE